LFNGKGIRDGGGDSDGGVWCDCPPNSKVTEISSTYSPPTPKGCGKTSVGEELARQLNCPFFDGDQYHPKENVEKMARGTPLTGTIIAPLHHINRFAFSFADEDRFPWLQILAKMIQEHIHNRTSAIFACSALKRVYRDTLRGHDLNEDTTSTEAEDNKHNTKESTEGEIIFVSLKGTFESIRERMEKRKHHFMPTTLLESQFATLEELDTSQERGIIVSIDLPVPDIVAAILKELQL